ncbi:helix-turn-helix domain-containing protein [Salibacterium aidingense]
MNVNITEDWLARAKRGSKSACADTLGINISTLVRKKKSWET